MNEKQFWTKMAAEYGINVAQGREWLQQEYGGDYTGVDPSALEAHLRGRFLAHGGYVHPDDARYEIKPWQAMQMPVARHHTMAAAQPIPDEGVPEGYFQYGENMYPEDVIGYTPGYMQTDQGVLTGVSDVSKFPKRWRQGFQQGPRLEFSGLDPAVEMSIRGQGVGMGEQVQRAQALVVMGNPGPEGTGYYDPSVGQVQGTTIRREILPENVTAEQVLAKSGMEVGGPGQPTPLYEGHTGATRAAYLASSTIQHAGVRTEDIEGHERNVLYYQTQDVYPQGAAAILKTGPKAVGVPLRGLQQTTGAQFAVPMRDPQVMASIAVGSMTEQEQTAIFGQPVSGQLTQEQYQQYMRSRDVRTHTLPPQVFQTDSDVYTALQESGQLTNVTDIGEGRVRAQRQVTGYTTPFGIQAQQSYRFHAQTITGEMFDVMAQSSPKFAEHIRNLARPATETLSNVAGATLANAGVAENYPTIKAADLDWGAASDIAQASVMEMGYESPEEAPGGVWHRAMATALEQQTQGKGIEFPAGEKLGGRLVMPSPGATRRYGGVTPTVEQTWGLYRRYGELINTYAEGEGASTPQYSRAVQSAGRALAEVTQSGEFRRAQRGYVVRGMGGGRTNPDEALPANRMFMNRKLLGEALEGMAPNMSTQERSELANRIFMGEEVAPRFRAFRYPITRKEEQLRMGVQYTSFPELKKIMDRPDMTIEEAEQLGSSVVFSPRAGEAQGGDWDWDPYAFVGGTRYQKGGGAEHMIGLSTPEEVIDLARRHPAGEHAALAQTIRDMPAPEKAAADLVMASRFVGQGDINQAFAARAEAKSGVGVGYNFAMRSLRSAIYGYDPASKQAMAELGNIYMIGQDIGGMGEQAGPVKNLIQQFSRMNASTMAGRKLDDEGFFNYKTPARWMSAVTKDIADLYKGEELGMTAQTRAVLLAGGQNENLGGITDLMQKYQGAEDDPMAQAKMLTRMRQLTVGKGPDEAVGVEEFVSASPTAGLIYSMAEQRDADRRGTTVRDEETGSVKGYAEAKPWQSELAELGGAQRGMAQVRYRQGEYAQMPFSEAAKNMATAAKSGILDPSATARIQRRLAMTGYTGPVAEEAAGQPDTIPQTSAEAEAMPARTQATGGASAAPSGPLGEAYSAIGGIIGGDPTGPDAPDLHMAAVRQARATRAGGGTSAYRQGFNEFVQSSGLSVPEATKVWRQALSQTGGPAFEGGVQGPGVSHQYKQYLAQGGAPAPAAGGGGAPAGGGGDVPPEMFDPNQGVGGNAVAGGGGGADRASTLLGGALERAAQGADEPFGMKITGGYTPGKGFSFSGGMFDTKAPADLALQMKETARIFQEKVQPALKDLGDTSGTLSKQQVRAAKQLGQMYDAIDEGMTQISQMEEDKRPAGMMDELGAMQDTMLDYGVPQLATRANIQSRYSAFGAGGAGFGGSTATGASFAGMTPGAGVGWGDVGAGMAGKLTNYFTLMRARRIWGMLGAPSFQNQQFAAQQQMAAYGAAQSLGFSETVPGGVAGGLMQRRVAQAQAKARYGMAGYRAWGSGAGGFMPEVRGILGPAAAGGALAAMGGSMMFSAMGGASAGASMFGATTAFGVGATSAAAVALPLATYGAGRYLGSFAEDTAINRAEMGTGGFLGRLRGYAGAIAGPALRGLAGDTSAYGEMWGNFSDVLSMDRDTRGLREQPLAAMGAGDRSAWLQKAAEQWAGKADTLWQGATPEEFMQQYSQAAAWQPWIGQMDYDQLSAQPPRLMERMQALGFGPEKYAQQVQRAGGGVADMSSFYMSVTGAGTTPFTRQQASTALGQWGGLFGKGVGTNQLLRGVQEGWLPAMSGDQLYTFQGLASGDRMAWARKAAQGSYMGVDLTNRPGLSAVEAETGMPLYTTRGLNEYGPFDEPMDRIRDGRSMLGGWGGMWGLQDTQRGVQRGYARQRFQEQQSWLGQQYSYYAADVHPLQRSISQQQRTISDTQWQYTQAGWGRQAEREQMNFGQGLESIALSRQIYMARRGYGQDDMQDQIDDENRRYQRLLVQRGWQQQDWNWGMQDIQTGRQRQQTQMGWVQEDWGYQATQRSAGYAQQMTQFGWQADDIQRNRATMLREFGWNMEDYSRNIRFASGRQREQLERQRERATVRFAEQYTQAGTQEERLEQREQWYEQQYAREESHFERQRERQEERWAWAEEDYDKDVERHQEALERLQQRWEWQDEDHERRLEDIEEKKDRENELHELRLQQFDMRERHLREDHEMRLEHWAEEHEEATKLRNLREQLRDDQEKLAELQREHQLESIERQKELNRMAEDYRLEINRLQDAILDLQRRQQAQVAAFESSVKRAFSDIVDHLEYESRSSMPPWAP